MVENDSLRTDHSGLNKFGWRSPDYKNILCRLEAIIDKCFGVPIIQESSSVTNEQVRQERNFIIDFEPIMEVVDNLVGREKEFCEIESHLQRKEGNGYTIVTIEGLGGIGKTQLASAYFNKTTQFYSARFRLDGSSRPSFESDFLKIATAAGLNDVSAALSETPMQRIWEWLNQKGNHRWLILLDNVDDPGDSAEQFDVWNFLNKVRQGSIIVTTRLRSLIPKSKIVLVERLSVRNHALSVLRDNAKQDILEGELTQNLFLTVLI